MSERSAADPVDTRAQAVLAFWFGTDADPLTPAGAQLDMWFRHGARYGPIIFFAVIWVLSQVFGAGVDDIHIRQPKRADDVLAELGLLADRLDQRQLHAGI